MASSSQAPSSASSSSGSVTGSEQTGAAADIGCRAPFHGRLARGGVARRQRFGSVDEREHPVRQRDPLDCPAKAPVVACQHDLHSLLQKRIGVQQRGQRENVSRHLSGESRHRRLGALPVARLARQPPEPGPAPPPSCRCRTGSDCRRRSWPARSAAPCRRRRRTSRPAPSAWCRSTVSSQPSARSR